MIKLFNQNWKYIAGGGTLLAYQAWYDRIKSAQKAQETKAETMEEFNSVKTQISELQNHLNNNSSNNKDEIVKKLEELKNDLNILKSKHNNYLSKFENGEVSINPENSASIYEQYKDTFLSASKSGNCYYS